MKTLLISCLLLALLPPVPSLRCQSCWNKGKDCLNPITEECDKSSDQSCMTALGVGRLSFLASTVTLKCCIETELCDEDYSSVSITSSMYIHSKISCCKTDMCNSGPPEMPENEKREPNGLKCPSCFSIFSDNCKSQQTVKCRNEEDQCFYYAGYFNFGESKVLGSVRGCATPSICEYGEGMAETDLDSVGAEITRTKCTEATEEDDIGL